MNNDQDKSDASPRIDIGTGAGWLIRKFFPEVPDNSEVPELSDQFLYEHMVAFGEPCKRFPELWSGDDEDEEETGADKAAE